MKMSTKTETITTLRNNILYYMSIGNYIEFCKLISSTNVNDIIDSKNGYTALHYAIRLNDEKMIQFLLNNHANPYLKTYAKEDSFDLSIKYQTKYVITNEMNTTNKTLSTLNRKIKDYEINNRYLVKSVDELTEQVITLRQNNGNLTEQVTTLKKENESLTNDVKSMKRNYDSLEQSYSGLLKKIRK